MTVAAQRIARINLLLSRPRGASMEELVKDLEVSRATVKRDIAYMRDQMNAPILWDRQQRSYRLKQGVAYAGPTYMVPGLWLSPAQAYAYLTLHNMVEKIAPSLLGPFIDPLRGTLKTLLCEADFPMYGLNRKIHIEMPPMPDLDDRSFSELVDALLHDAPVIIETRTGEILRGIPRRLDIAGSHWTLSIETESGKGCKLDVAELVDITWQKEPNT